MSHHVELTDEELPIISETERDRSERRSEPLLAWPTRLSSPWSVTRWRLRLRNVHHRSLSRSGIAGDAA
jgi:hypothetical protein